ncbi:MAG: type III-B CRISPR module RAMP protein Cmr1 [Deltaproteobacteria bacterium]|nr:type III-B CRISPR module RAMP protein Cmr1 [Deltaproteobacteria bacterium]
MQKTEIGIRTLTPLWTGDIGSDSSYIRETGLMGSLRWWYEGIIRCMGGRVCNPLRECSCEFKVNEPESPEEQLCPTCLLFGCTGWQRSFRLEVTDLEPLPLFFVANKGVYQSSGNWLWRIFGAEKTGGKRRGRGAGIQFTFGVHALWGTKGRLRIIPLRTGSSNVIAQLSYLLNIISKWGALGAKTQHGFGQVALTDIDLIDEGFRKVHSAASRSINRKKRGNDPGCFNLARFFAQTYDLGYENPYEKSGKLIGDPGNFAYKDFFIPCSFDIRYKSCSRDPSTGQGKDFGMRPWFKNKKCYSSQITENLFGKSKTRKDEDRSGSRIGVSHLYRKQKNGSFYVKVWGHVPDVLEVKPEDIAYEVDAFMKTMFPSAKLRTKFSLKEVLGS